MRSFHRHGRDTGFPCLLEYLGDVDTRSFQRHGRDIGFRVYQGTWMMWTRGPSIDTVETQVSCVY